MKKHLWKNLLTFMISVCLLVSNIHITWANSDDQFALNQGIRTFLNKADTIEVLDENIVYTFYDYNATVSVSKTDTGMTKLVVDEGACHNMIEIDKNNQMYLNGKKVEVTITEDEESAVEAKSVTGTSYKTTPAYGSASDYTYYVKTARNADVKFSEAVVTLGIVAFTILLGHYYPAVKEIESLAPAVFGLCAAKNTNALSFQTRVTHHKNYTGGWNTSGTYCAQNTTTWYSGTDFQGQSVVTVDYEIRHLI